VGRGENFLGTNSTVILLTVCFRPLVEISKAVIRTPPQHLRHRRRGVRGIKALCVVVRSTPSLFPLFTNQLVSLLVVIV
jgi:hypothetical protein